MYTTTVPDTIFHLAMAASARFTDLYGPNRPVQM